MILVIGASGNVGSYVLQHLLDRGVAVRAFVHSESSASRVSDWGADDVVMGDLHVDNDVQKAMEGCRSAFHIAPPFVEEEVEIGQRVIDAAHEAGLEHIVFNSVLHPQLTELHHHYRKLQVEERLIEAELDYNILQPAMYMQNLRQLWPSIANHQTLTAFSDPDKPLSLIDTYDLGEAAATLLTQPEWRNATFELAGPDTLSYREMAHTIGDQLEQEIHIKPLDEEERKALAGQMGWSEYATQAFLAMARHYDRHGFVGGSPQVLQHLLGREPHHYTDFLQRFIRHMNDQKVES